MGKKEFIREVKKIIKSYDYDHASLTDTVDYIINISRIYELKHKKVEKDCDPQLLDMMIKEIKSGRKPTDMFGGGEY